MPKGAHITTNELLAAARQAIEAKNKTEDVKPVRKTKKRVDLDDVTFGDDQMSDVEPMHLLDTVTDQEYLTDKDSHIVKRP